MSDMPSCIVVFCCDHTPSISYDISPRVLPESNKLSTRQIIRSYFSSAAGKKHDIYIYIYIYASAPLFKIQLLSCQEVMYGVTIV